ncbi:MAG: DUF433 domain-containing protein [Chloroflexi bacterium]|nr:DUF433 domain-containing protein [Chloroflexota bacterium]
MAIATRVTRTQHRHIVKRRGARGSVAEIKGTGIDVWAIVGYHRLGKTAEQIRESFPHLSLAQIYDALSYYYDHPAEIDAILARQQMDEKQARALQDRVNTLLADRKAMNRSQVKERAAELRKLLNP